MFRRIRTIYRIYRVAWNDRRTPLGAKALPLLSLLYILWPIDLIPDVLPLLGQLDDIGIIILFCLWALRMIPDEVKRTVTRRDVIDVEARRS